MSFDAERFDPEGPTESRWPTILAWTALLLIALAVMEFTAHPAVGVMIGCSKFGWDDFRNAVWLRRVDPYRARGRVCSWFYIAVGFWKIAFISLPVLMLIVFLVGFVEQNRAGPRNDPKPTAAIVGAMIATSGSFTLAGLVSCWSFWLAVRNGVRVWIDASVRKARRSKTWPPFAFESNLAAVLLVTALVPAAFIACALSAVGILTLLLPIIRDAFAGKPPQHVVVATIAVPLAVLGVATLFTVRWIRNWLARRAIAATPFECWLAPSPPDESDPFEFPINRTTTSRRG